MNARKLPSGRWQSKVYIGTVDGKKQFVSITADSKKECLIKAAAIKTDDAVTSKLTVNQAVTQYVAAKRGVLSPATVAGYLAKQRQYISCEPIGSVQIPALTTQKVQTWISGLAKKVSRKTIKNTFTVFLSSVRMFSPAADFRVTFPQGERYDGYVPSTEEVLQVLSTAKKTNTDMYRACLLASFGTMRRGEIVCLTADDIHGNTIHISRDMVKDENKQWVVKPPKTTQSVRDVVLPDWVISEIPKAGRLVDLTPNEITTYFGRLVAAAGVPHFRFHDLRKHAVSLMAQAGVSMASIQKAGGWSNLQTPTQIYIKALADAHKREMAGYVSYVERIGETAKL